MGDASSDYGTGAITELNVETIRKRHSVAAAAIDACDRRGSDYERTFGAAKRAVTPSAP